MNQFNEFALNCHLRRGDKMIRKGLIFLFTVLTVSGCYLFYSASKPMKYIEKNRAGKGKNLIIFLPGRQDRAEDFIKEGFLDVVKEKNIEADLIFADAHFGYYINRNLRDRLSEDIIQPAMGKGYEKIILIGVSAGGLGSILYSMKHENQIDAIVAISPYLGDEEILEEIKNQGGVRNWKVDKKPDEEEEWQRAMWYWIKENYSKENEKAPILFVGSGREDYVMEGVRLLIPLIPEERTVFVKGKHEWEPWREILGKILEKKTFRKILASKKTAEGD
jgi:hypothetical protein